MRALLALFLILLAAWAGTAAAQTPVERCSQQCAATDPDVNDPALRTEGPVNVILYGHFEDVLNAAPMNTVPPDPAHERDLDSGFTMPTVDTDSGVCVPPGGTTCADFHFKNGQIQMWFCPGLIEFRPEGWYRGCHTHSLGHPLELAGPAVLYVYLSADSAPETTGPPASTPSVMPALRVAASIRLGTDRPQIFASGVSEAATLVSTTGRSQVYEFRVELVPRPDVRGDDGRWTLGGTGNDLFTVVANVEQLKSEEGGNRVDVSQGDWRLRTGPSFPPRIILPTFQPLRGTGIESVTVEGVPYVRYGVASAFGSYDVDVGSIHARIVGPEGSPPPPPETLELVNVKRSNDHDGVLKPAFLVWRIHPELLNESASAYKVHVSARNLQGTFEVADWIPLPIAAFDGEASVPGFGATLLVTCFALLALAARARRRTR